MKESKKKDIDFLADADKDFDELVKKNEEDIEHFEAQIVPAQPSGMVKLVCSIEEAKAAYLLFQKLKTSVLTKKDVHLWQGKTPSIKRSGWRKIASAFGLSDDIVSKEIRRNPVTGRVIEATFVVRALAPNGRFMTGIASCSIHEAKEGRSFRHPDHEIIATAHTRAKSRAIADLVGAGEVSYEELE